MSTDACYAARASTRTQVLDAIKRLSLSKNSSEQYNHDDAVKYFAAIKRVLKETYNPGGGKLESSSTKIVQCPGPVKFSSFQPPERVFCVFRETGFQFSSCDRFSFLRKSSAVTYSFVHLGWIAFLLVLLCERKREKACFAPFLRSCVLSCRFFSIWTCLFVGFCVAILSEQPRASLLTCALGL